MRDHLIKLVSILFGVVAVTGGQSLSQYSALGLHAAGATFAVSGGDMDRSAMLASMLGLNQSEQGQAKTVFDEEAAIVKPLMEQLQKATDDLAAAEKNGAPDAEIDQLARNMAGISGEILAADAKAQSRIYAQLTAAQKQKLEQLPHPVFAPFAPLFPPGPVFISTSGGHGPN